MYCTKCGNELEDNSNFCSFCGHKARVREDEGVADSKDVARSELCDKRHRRRRRSTKYPAEKNLQTTRFDESKD